MCPRTDGHPFGESRSGQYLLLPLFPTERTTEIGQLISSYLAKQKNLEDHTVHLLFSANRWEHVPLMKEKLHQGITLVVDRYAFSGVAFTSAKELSPEEAAERGNFGNERYENSSFQQKVLQSFHHLMKDKSLNWKTIDASKSIEDLHREIKSVAEETIQEVQNKPLGELWN
ncbi:PREDICTED: thymidylate kinase [Phaethon lepturus]|uniref:thymidylate kinase n=1 Tax=Phaethon lepturus TaxID=97097 RepID=UPI000530A020|nr:PREDICTED: thymidylate kinase [Phaethon lepturus]